MSSLTELRGYADTIHWTCAGSSFISFCNVGRAIDIAVEFATWKGKSTTWSEKSLNKTSLWQSSRRLEWTQWCMSWVLILLAMTVVAVMIPVIWIVAWVWEMSGLRFFPYSPRTEKYWGLLPSFLSPLHPGSNLIYFLYNLGILFTYEEKTVNRGRRPKKLDGIISTIRWTAVASGRKRTDETRFDFFGLTNEVGDMIELQDWEKRSRRCTTSWDPWKCDWNYACELRVLNIPDVLEHGRELTHWPFQVAARGDGREMPDWEPPRTRGKFRPVCSWEWYTGLSL